MTAARRSVAAFIAFVLLALGVPGAVGTTSVHADERRSAFPLDPALLEELDDATERLSASSCVTVRVGSADLYERRGTTAAAPASTLKILTAHTALEELGPEHRFTTTLIGGAPIDGVIVGDVGLVGGGDPLLATEAVVERRRIEDRHPTLLDSLADRIAESGVQRIEGRIIGDERRYDDERVVPTWPSRFIDQEQIGPMSALLVDNGYDWNLDEDDVSRRRSPDPAGSAAALLTELLEDRGVAVLGEPGSGPAPEGTAIATIDSAPLTDIVDVLLLRSDNQIAELLAKELGVARGGHGSTEAGVDVLREMLGTLVRDTAGSHLADASGLDPMNRLTCDQLVEVLDASGGVDGVVGGSLPVAGESGTLSRRFVESPARNRMRAKTGRLNGVSSLAGFLTLATGEEATFAIVVNDQDDEGVSFEVQEDLVESLVGLDLPCQDLLAPLVLPGSTAVGLVGTVSMFPIQTVTLPALLAPMGVFEAEQDAILDPCLAIDDDFSLVLSAPRAHEASDRSP